MLPESGTSLVDLMSDPMIESLLNMPGVGDAFGGSLSMITGFLNDGYTMYTIMIDCDAESDEASAALTDIRTILGQYFGDDYYITGMSQAVSDLQEITPTDFNIVTIVSVAIILVVLLFTLRSVKMSAIIIAVIEFGIFINLTLCYIVGQEINFMAYIILSSISSARQWTMRSCLPSSSRIISPLCPQSKRHTRDSQRAAYPFSRPWRYWRDAVFPYRSSRATVSSERSRCLSRAAL